MSKTLQDMEAEVAEYCRLKGWYVKEVPISYALALLHSEVSEAVEAWRIWGTGDGTAGSGIIPGGNPGAKPEGVGSELADVLIRLLDDSVRYDLRLPEYPRRSQFRAGADFLKDMNTLHDKISLASVNRGELGPLLADVLDFVTAVVVAWGIDLQAEYERKMAYNMNRPYRHGGKRV